MEINSRKQLDRLGKRFKYLEDQPFDRVMLQDYRDFRAEALPTLFETQKLILNGLPILQSARAKRTETIVRKLRRESTMQLSSVSDIIGFRIIVPSPRVQSEVLKILIGSLDDISGVDDYIEKARSTGYRAAHIKVRIPMRLPENSSLSSFLYEIQIRTVYQHIWATMSESFGENVKITGGTGTIREFLRILSEKINSYEAVNDDLSQDQTIKYVDGIQFVLGVFENLRDPRLIRHGANIASAVTEMRAFEDRVNLNEAEVVLLATSANKEDLEKTHMRYFTHMGIPEIPQCLEFNELRPT